MSIMRITYLESLFLGSVGLCWYNFEQVIYLEHQAKFCQRLALECTKVMKVGLFLELDTLGLPSAFWFNIEGLATSLCQASKLVYSAWILHYWHLLI